MGGMSRVHEKLLRFLLLMAMFGTIVAGSAFPQADRGQALTRDPWRAVPPGFHPALQKTLSAESDRWRVVLTEWTYPCPNALSDECYSFRAQDRLAHSVTTFRLANQTAQVDALSIVDQSRLAILGHALPNLAVVSLTELPSGKEIDHFVCGWPSLSPDGRIAAYIMFVPAHPGYGWSPSDDYLVYDLTASPEDNRPPANRAVPPGPYDVGWPIWPEGAKNSPGDNMFEGQDVPVHWMASEGFFWLGKFNRVAFVDRWQGVESLIIADLRDGIQHPKVSARPIPTSEILDLASSRSKVAPSDFESWSKDPSTLIYVKDIQQLPSDSHTVRLSLAPHPCLSTASLDIRIDDPN
jgi:hypothetical protein